MSRTISDVNWCDMACEPSRNVESISRTDFGMSLFLRFRFVCVRWRRLQQADRGAIGVAHDGEAADVRYVLGLLDDRRTELRSRRYGSIDVVDLNRAQPVGLRRVQRPNLDRRDTYDRGVRRLGHRVLVPFHDERIVGP